MDILDNLPSYSSLLQVSFIALFLLLGWLLPREPGALISRETWVNAGTGALLFGLRLLLIRPAESLVQQGWLDASALHPLLQLLICFLALDLFRYWLHRAHHRVPWLWRFHRVHHSIRRLDATAGLRMHCVDLIQLAALPLLLFHLLLHGPSLEPWVIPAALLIGALFDAFEHANLRMNPRHPFWRVWGVVLNSPHFHSWHHTRDGHRRDGNYGNALVIWDRLFGSDVTGPQPPELYGLPDEQDLSPGLLGLQLLRAREPQARV